MNGARAAIALTLTFGLCAAKPAAAQVRNLAQPGAVAVEAPPSGASFERRARIEQQTPAGWQTVFDEFDLAADCNAAATLPACVTLAPGAVLRPVPWNGFTCYGQCPRPCKGNVYRPPGTFRVVLKACGSGAEVAGPPFHMGQRARQ